ncbi:MAG: beta-ketoacyl-ACP synthase III [Francisellaceae bacterium]
MYARITATGSYLPEKVLHNDDLAKFVDTSDAWIRQRVGIRQRHIASEDETTTFMAEMAARAAIDSSGLNPQDIDLIIVATGTADYLMPSTACLLQHALSVPNCPAFDISAACSGFVYAVDVAKQYLENGSAKHVLVVASERMSRTLNWKDRATCVLFGDGAGAVILSQSREPGILSSLLHADGSLTGMLNIKSPLPQQLYGQNSIDTSLHMEGSKVFKHAVIALSELADALVRDAGLNQEDIDWLIPHQANYRILEATAKKLGLPMSQVVLTLQNHGNTSAASIPLALDYAVKNQQIKRGDIILTEAFGAGIVWGGFVARY